MKGSEGVTFVGVVIAALVIALAVIPLMGLLTTQTRETRMSRDRIFAQHLAHNLVERFRLEPIDQVRFALDSLAAGEAFVRDDPLLNADGASEAYRRMLARFRRSVVFVPETNRKGRLDTLVQWAEDGRVRQVRVSTLLVDDRLRGGKP